MTEMKTFKDEHAKNNYKKTKISYVMKASGQG